MSISVSLHTKNAEKFEVSARMESNTYSGSYPVVSIASKPQGSYDFQDVTLFASVDQLKVLHKQLSKLMKELHEEEKLQKKAQKFSQLVEANPLQF